jgi:hypothetical protein
MARDIDREYRDLKRLTEAAFLPDAARNDQLQHIRAEKFNRAT